jgi:hypothetical protein
MWAGSQSSVIAHNTALGRATQYNIQFIMQIITKSVETLDSPGDEKDMATAKAGM